MLEKVPVYPNIWEEEGGAVYLVGSSCTSCGEVYFPPKEIQVCSHCQSDQLQPIRFSREGVILSFTTVHQKPAGGYYKGPVPFHYALVELPEGVIVQTHLIHVNPEHLKIGDKVEVVLDTLFEDEGQEIIAYKFQPVTR